MNLLEQALKTLPLFGINDLQISFDVANRQVIATFTYQNQHQEKAIAFDEIENNFNCARGDNPTPHSTAPPPLISKNSP